ncbi:hypothetical protein HS088_TW21G00846 [Tripterygium wilfordii]|uniref:Pentatricopeptide repeat-containing protein n=1 Tax=Tripterygium wilfordii TaxID=458696 RepID=A0A7J7C4K0_TRIWF|nr:hypothetical protein HS088_TW21G00846 [Tripterygium wilfordii]
MYANCGEFGDARTLFDAIPERSVVSWNALCSCYEKSYLHDKAVFLFQDMVSSGIRPNEFRLSGIIKSCTRLMDGDRGTQIHGYIIKLRIMYQVLLKLVLEWVSRELGRQLHSCLIKMDAKSDSFVCVGLIDMYSNRHLRDDVRMVFKLMPENDLITWNAVISGHSFNGEDMDSLRRAGYYQVLIACLPALQILFICC